MGQWRCEHGVQRRWQRKWEIWQGRKGPDADVGMETQHEMTICQRSQRPKWWATMLCLWANWAHGERLPERCQEHRGEKGCQRKSEREMPHGRFSKGIPKGNRPTGGFQRASWEEMSHRWISKGIPKGHSHTGGFHNEIRKHLQILKRFASKADFKRGSEGLLFSASIFGSILG